VTIEQLREQQHLTQREFAYLIGVTEKSVQRWESGARGITRRHRDAIKRKFGVEVDTGDSASA
jgi:DNA-binding transcriptional regulator YiaG